MSLLIAILICIWVLKASADLCVGLIQFFVGILAGLIGAAIYMTILLVSGFAWLWRMAFPKV
jgi:hypothetical protein